MLDYLSELETRVYVSRSCGAPIPPDAVLITTFSSPLTFLFNSLYHLPILLWRVYAEIRRGSRTLYFPVFHHWNPAIILLAKWLGARTVLTVHDAVPHPGERALGQSLFQQLAIRWCDRIVVLSDFVKMQLPIVVQRKAIVIPHPILPSDAPERALSKPPALLFLGRIAYYKGIDLLLAAVKDLPKGKIDKLTIAGMSMMNISLPKTKFPIDLQTKWLTDKEMQTLLQTHDILVLPYREASQSGVATLGIAAAIPMVVTNVGGLTEQLQADEAIWVEPEIANIRAGIFKLIENPDLYQSIHQKLKYKKLSEVNQAIGKQLFDLLQDL